MLSDIKILLIDDESFILSLLGTYLHDLHITEVFKANSASEGLKYFYIEQVDLVFLDIDMPDTNGFEVLERILEIDKDAYIVMLSGLSTMDNVSKALKMGAKGFIAKPYTQDKIKKSLKSFCNKRK